MATEGDIRPETGDEHAPEETNDNPRGDDGLPKSFDVLIIGTGVTESILSAAISRNGHSVLHLDPREYYGGTWATFSLDQWTSKTFLETPTEASVCDLYLEDSKGALTWRNNVEQFEQLWYLKDEETKSQLMSQKRRFNIDLMPRLIAAREDIIQILITSNVSRYLEFLKISRLLTNLPPPNEDVIESIPLSRADIFTSKSLSLVEKRSLVKLIEAVLQPTSSVQDEAPLETSVPEEVETTSETFEDLVKKTKVPDKLKHMVKSSFTTLEDGFSPDGFNVEFCSRCRLFLNSIGRYGNQTPFLWTIYGISEVCQAFCRLSAVYGGIFILKRHLSRIEAKEDGFVVQTEKDEVKVKHIILGPDMQCDIIGKDRSKKEQASIVVGRAVLITKGGSIKRPDENSKPKGDGIFVYRLSGMEVIEMNHISQAVPKDYRLLQVTFPISDPETTQPCRSIVETLLSPFVQFRKHTEECMEDSVGTNSSSGAECCSEDSTTTTEETIKPQVIYGSYFKLTYSCDSLFSELYRNSRENSDNYIMTSDIGSAELTKYVLKAKSIFSTLYPDEEFLPKAPDCDEPDAMNGDDIDTSELSPAIENPVVNPEVVNEAVAQIPNDNENEGAAGEG
ncbi:Rab proteins geranylgeranyltransferase component A [Orchesella cincta]|uniref:Rab proteins geranylgeranyltransferase component A n=1 Tax=Orchesella cincta TaxID=48709 RepID=A0A1D2M561_ORCCI|nr:Rab proteins geranylgeranyltransferase component A [Orchesella cincta]